MRSHGVKYELVCKGIEDRAARSHGIAGAAGGRGDNDTVTLIDGEEIAVDAGLDAYDPSHAPSRYNDVVQCKVSPTPPALSVGRCGWRHDLRLERGPTLDPTSVSEEPWEVLEGLGGVEFVHKPDSAHVDAKDGGPGGQGKMGHPQHGAVSPDADQQVPVADTV